MNDTVHPTASTEPLNAQDRASCATMAALLHAATELLRPGWRTLLAAVAWLAFGAAAVQARQTWPMPALNAAALGVLLVSALLGLVLRVQHMRMCLDERLFAALAQGHIGTLDSLDTALALVVGRRQPAGTSPRHLDQRIRGTQALARRAVLTMVGQIATIIVALLLSVLMLADPSR